MATEVWITGIGLVTPLGVGWRETWDAMCRGRSGVHPIRSFDPSGIATRFAGEVPESFEERFRAACRLPFPKRYARFTHFAIMAGRLALEDAGLDLDGEDLERIGVSVGVGAGSFDYLLPVDEALRDKDQGLWPALDHNYVVKHMTNAAAAQLTIWLGLQGPSTSISLACATGAQSIAIAMDWIDRGRADVVLAGAADATLKGIDIHANNQNVALTTNNDDTEGAALLVLESEAHARSRGAERIAALLGHAMTSEAYNIVNPRPDGVGMARCMALALADAGLEPERIDYISAHGTSTQANDSNESAAIKAVFGAHARRLPVSSQKSMIGHAIGATSAIEVGVTALSLRHGVITPTINYREPDPACDLDYVPNEAREAELGFALSNAFGFGGHNCCLVLGK